MWELLSPIFSIRLLARIFGANAVMNIELVTQVLAIATHVINEPIFRGSLSGNEPYKAGMFFTIGKMVPPLLALFDGINGASIRSDRAIE